jgi:Domain of unknown function (DUF4193)
LNKPIDNNAPRRPAVEIDDDSLEQLTTHSTAAPSSRVDLDETEAAETFELPGADLASEELTMTVLPMQTDEFRCTRCFLVHHRSRLAARADGQDVCPECA